MLRCEASGPLPGVEVGLDLTANGFGGGFPFVDETPGCRAEGSGLGEGFSCVDAMPDFEVSELGPA
jgi:hypothetical protein